MKSFYLIVCLALSLGSNALFGQTKPIVRFHTDLGDIDVLLLQDIAPLNVANFLNYVNNSAYDNSFIHRSPPNFVVQGGGFKFVNGSTVAIAQNSPVVNEFHASNLRGTLAMAKLAGNPDSATNQWFFNESDSNAGSPAFLDTQNGGYTVFGRITSASGLTTMDTIAAVPIYNAGGAPFDQIPLQNYTSGNTIQNANLIHVIWIKVVPQVLAITRTNATTIHIQGVGAPNKNYKVERGQTLTGTTFPNSTSVTADANGNISYNDTNAVSTTKYYRISTP